MLPGARLPVSSAPPGDTPPVPAPSPPPRAHFLPLFFLDGRDGSPPCSTSLWPPAFSLRYPGSGLGPRILCRQALQEMFSAAMRVGPRVAAPAPARRGPRGPPGAPGQPRAGVLPALSVAVRAYSGQR